MSLFGKAKAFSDVVSQINKGLTNPLRTTQDVLGRLPLRVPGLAANLGQGVQEVSGIGRPQTSSSSQHVLNGAKGRQDPLLNFTWFAVFPEVQGVTLPWNYIEELTAPFRSIDVVDRYERGKMKHYAGAHSISSLSCQIYDDSSGLGGAYLEAWRSLVIRADGIYNYPGQYKKDIQVVILDVTREVTVYTLVYKGCFPSSLDPYSLQSASSDRLVLNQEFSVDDVEFAAASMPVSEFGTIAQGSTQSFPESLVNELSGVRTVASRAQGLFKTGQQVLNIKDKLKSMF